MNNRFLCFKGVRAFGARGDNVDMEKIHYCRLNICVPSNSYIKI